MTKRITPYFNIYGADFKAFKDKISPQEWFEICDAISDICVFGEADFKPKPRFQKTFYEKIKNSIEKNSKSYNASIENGRKGGRPKALDKKPIGYKQVNLDKTYLKPIEENIIEENIIEEKIKQKKFIPPKLDEIKKYIKENQFTIDAEYFFKYFQEGDWIDSNGKKVRNWKQKIITWENRNKKEQPNKKTEDDRAWEKIS